MKTIMMSKKEIALAKQLETEAFMTPTKAKALIILTSQVADVIVQTGLPKPREDEFIHIADQLMGICSIAQQRLLAGRAVEIAVEFRGIELPIILNPATIH